MPARPRAYLLLQDRSLLALASAVFGTKYEPLRLLSAQGLPERVIRDPDVCIIVTQTTSAGESNIPALAQVKRARPNVQTILIIGEEDFSLAIEAAHHNAADQTVYEPVNPNEFKNALVAAMTAHQLRDVSSSDSGRVAREMRSRSATHPG